MIQKQGWVKLHRKILDNPIICKDSEYFSVWCYLILNATHTEYDVIFNKERIRLKPGQLITGRKVISEKFNINESKVTRILNKLESEQQIEQQTTNKNRLISIVNWSLYQDSEQQIEQQIEQQVNNKRTTNEQQVNTNKNVKNVKNEKEDNIYSSVIDYLNEKTNKKFTTKAQKNISLIKARQKEGRELEDFKKVIDVKSKQWLKTDMEKYLRPETLFGNKFESYLNEHIEVKSKPKSIIEFDDGRPKVPDEFKDW